jgi:CDP-diacylglycerol--glycerol-3-phosphate 3-phosphatidyltransferase
VLLTKFSGWQFEISRQVLAAGIFAVASLTDWADGYLARRRKQVTGLGQWMDPLADKLLVTAALISLVQMELAASWMVAVILGREFVVTLLRSVAHARGLSLPASPVGKLKMVAQVVAILALILGGRRIEALYLLGTVALWVATGAALVSAAGYYRHFNILLGVKPVASLPAAGDAVSRRAPVDPSQKRVSA